LIRVFGGDRLKFYQFLPIADHEAIQHSSISWLIEQAQKKIEGQNFDIRKHVTDYDDVINRQRSVIYTRRHKVLMNEDFEWKKEVEKTIYREVYRIIKDLKQPRKADSNEYKDYLQRVSSDLKGILKLTDFDVEVLRVLFKDEKYKSKRISLFLTEKLLYQLNRSWDEYIDSEQAAVTRFSFLRAIDILWTEHLVTIEHLQDAVRLRGYSQKDPLTEFKEEGLKIFINLLEEIDKEIARTIFKISPDFVPAGIMKTS
jgi:preprotein translocase subunit SecA